VTAIDAQFSKPEFILFEPTHTRIPEMTVPMTDHAPDSTSPADRESKSHAPNLTPEFHRESGVGLQTKPMDLSNEKICFQINNLNLHYGTHHAIRDVSMAIPHHRITAFIGPSGCGKSSLLRCMNRMNDLIDIAKVSGEILLEGQEIYDKRVDVSELRRRVGMVFQKPNPFPKSIYENVAYGLRIQGERRRSVLDESVERSLRNAALWDEVKDRLKAPAISLSGGQQQRLVIARAIAIEPEVILLDEPCSALDPIATAKVEDLMIELKKKYTLIIVTHNMQQAARVGDYCAFMYMGELVEYNSAEVMFKTPAKKQTEDYITGRFG